MIVYVCTSVHTYVRMYVVYVYVCRMYTYVHMMCLYEDVIIVLSRVVEVAESPTLSPSTQPWEIYRSNSSTNSKTVITYVRMYVRMCCSVVW